MIGDPEQFDHGDEGWVRLSSLRHFAYCPRSWALIERECVFEENLFTQRGRRVHENVDAGRPDSRDGVRAERSLELWSDALGLYGVADLVEFHGDQVVPVEYKLSTRKRQREGEILQLAGQALCLEAMFDVPVPRGAIYHHGSRDRSFVEIDDDLRGRVRDALDAIHQARRATSLPVAPADARCKGCSLVAVCLPHLFKGGRMTGWTRRRSTLFHISDDDNAIQ